MIKKTIKKTQKKSSSTSSRSISFHDTLIEQLKDHDFAVEYLNNAISESLKGETDSQEVFLTALKNVAEAQGNMSDLAKRAHMRRESLYRMLSVKGNPELSSLTSLLHAMGFQLNVR